MNTTISHLKFKSGDLVLSGTLVTNETPCLGLIRISGGAHLPHWPNEWQTMLAAASIASLSFDYPGVGESEGVLGNTNLTTRILDSESALELFIKETKLPLSNIILMGASMGGPVAISLAVKRAVGGLLLAVPAAYSEEARSKNFGEAFSQVIRRENGWVGSPDFKELEKYQGRTMLAYGTRDTVIPKGVIDAYTAIIQKKGKVLALDASHTFMREKSDEQEAKDQFWREVVKWAQEF